MKVSIITICYNSESTIERCIQSVYNQSYKNIEYIIIDGGSTDSTVQIIQKWSKLFQTPFKWLSESDKGISDAFNKGLNLCEGDYIGIINSDDWYDTIAIENAVNNLKECSKKTILCGDIHMVSKDVKVRKKSMPSEFPAKMKIMHPSVFMSKELYTQLVGFDEKYKIAMDYELLCRAVVLYNATFIHVPFVFANMSVGGISNDGLRNKIKGLKEGFRIRGKYLNSHVRNLVYLCLSVVFVSFNHALNSFSERNG